MTMNLYAKFNTIHDFSFNEQAVVDFIIEDPNQFLGMTTEEICEHCYVSKSTIHRLCKKLDVEGVKELKVLVTMSMIDRVAHQKVHNFNQPFVQSDSNFDVIANLRSLYEQTVILTSSSIEMDKLDKMILAINKAASIDIYVNSTYEPMAHLFRNQMLDIGKMVHVFSDGHEQFASAHSSNDTHVAIVITYDGSLDFSYDLITMLKRNRTEVILISSMQNHGVSHMGTYNLYLTSKEDEKMLSPFSSKLSLMYVLDMIYGQYFKLNYDQNYQFVLKKRQKYQTFFAKKA